MVAKTTNLSLNRVAQILRVEAFNSVQQVEFRKSVQRCVGDHLKTQFSGRKPFVQCVSRPNGESSNHAIRPETGT
jgi:hypothetical protein